MIKIDLIRRDLIGKKLLLTVKTISPGRNIDKHGNCGYMPNLTESNLFNVLACLRPFLVGLKLHSITRGKVQFISALHVEVQGLSVLHCRSCSS